MRKVYNRMLDALGLSLMGERYQMLTLTYLLLMIYTTIESVFVNTLLHRISGDMSYVMLYRGIGYAVSAIMMNVAAVVSQKSNPVAVLRMGAGFYLLSYIGLVFGMEYMEVMRFIIPVFSGAAGAFYWSGHNSLVLEYSSPENRDLGLGIFGIVSGVTTLIIPVITGFVISLMPGNWGYQVMFAAGMIFVAIQFVLATRLTLEEGSKDRKRKSRYKQTFQLFREKQTLRFMLYAEAIRGARDGIFAFILNMMLFEIIADERLTGINTFLTGIMAIIGSWVYGRFVQPRIRGKYMNISITIILVFTSFLFYKMNAATLMIFTAINAFFQLFINNTNNSNTYDVTSQTKETLLCTREIYGIREVALAVGRIAGLIYGLLAPKSQVGYVVLLSILTLIQYFSAFFIQKTYHILEDKRIAEEATTG